VVPEDDGSLQMRFFELLVESAPAKKRVGRDYDHLEDLVYTDVENGAVRATNLLKMLANDSGRLSVKWDGAPTVFWGRDQDGVFMLLGKNNWGREEGRNTSPDQLEKFILSRGKGEEWRPKFAKDLSDLWPVFQAATPKDFRGFIYGDLLFYPGKPFEESEQGISFTPNQTTYTVTGESADKFSKARVAVAAHLYLDEFGDPVNSGTPFTDTEKFSTEDLKVVGQTYVKETPEIDSGNLDDLATRAGGLQNAIKNFFQPRQGLSDLQNIVYTYVNQRSREKNLEQLGLEDFSTWLSSSKVSTPKQSKINALTKDNRDFLTSMFGLIKDIMTVKDHIIDQLDKSKGDIIANTKGTPGGEGYLSHQDMVKLVPRHRWQPYRPD
jgi:hypothetical protein